MKLTEEILHDMMNYEEERNKLFHLVRAFCSPAKVMLMWKAGPKQEHSLCELSHEYVIYLNEVKEGNQKFQKTTKKVISAFILDKSFCEKWAIGSSSSNSVLTYKSYATFIHFVNKNYEKYFSHIPLF